MFIYEQSTGKLYKEGGTLIGSGYSGNGPGLNNPAMQRVHDVGPLPEGFYSIGPSYHHPKLGAVTMDLTPDPETEMFGRDDFRIHGDNVEVNHTASEGCIVQGLVTRETVDADPDRRLQVVATL